jgi:hypothetical protein
MTQRKKKQEIRQVYSTFAINERQPIGRDVVIAECIHGRDIRQRRHLVVRAWWERLGAYLVLVVNIQKARDNRGNATGRRGLREIGIYAKDE